MNTQYIKALLDLRRTIDNRIDNEIEETLRGREDSKRLMESIEYNLCEKKRFIYETTNE